MYVAGEDTCLPQSMGGSQRTMAEVLISYHVGPRDQIRSLSLAASIISPEPSRQLKCSFLLYI